jgi:hypothetical protein
MAEMVALKCANSEIKVKLEIVDENKFGYAPVLKMNLDTTKLQMLGWTSTIGLKEMFLFMIKTMKV